MPATRPLPATALAVALTALTLLAPAATSGADDPLGTIEIAPGAAVTIGAWGSLTGTEAGTTDEWMNAAELAIAQAGGQLGSHPITLTRVDAGCSTAGGAAAAEQLVADPSVVALLGANCSDETVGGIAAVSAAGLTTISPSNTRASLTDPARGPELAGYLRTVPSDAFLAEVAAGFAAGTIGARTVVTIGDGSGYANDLVRLFGAAFAAQGGSVLADLTVGADGSTVPDALAAAADQTPDLLFLALLPADAAATIDGARSTAGLAETTILGGDGLFTQELVAQAGPAAEGIYVTGPAVGMYAPSYADLVAAYTDRYGIAPTGAYHATAYDAAGILLTALGTVATEEADGTLRVGKGALRDALFATSGYAGVTGTLSCTASGDCGAPDIAVYAIGPEVVAGAWPPPVAVTGG